MAKILKKRFEKRNSPPGGGSDTSDGDAIKVFIRIRPPDSYDVDIGQHRSIVVDSSGKTLIVQSKPEKVFTFDKIIKEDATQDGIFSLVGKEIIDSCISGYNGTIFAYGQTGSGKTYTMLGPSEDAENFQHELRGIVPRSFEYLFHVAKREQELIYKETVKDLLKPSTDVALKLRKSTKKGIHAVGLTEVTVTSPSEAYQVLSRGWRNRRVASTSMNRESSRSHAVFSVIIESKENKQGLQNVKTSRLNLVDLAGSERQKDTNAVGKRLKEASSINTSLSTLGNVIKCLVDKAQFIPYRNSKLTFLLRDSLGGNAKTHLISCVHPSSRFIGDTLSTLQFAKRAKMIKNTATVNLDTQGDIPTLQAEIRCLKEQLRQVPSGITASSVIQQSASGETQVAVSSEADKQVLQDRVDSLVQQIQDLESRSQSLQLTIDRLSMALQETEEEESSQKDKVEFLEKAETVSSQKIAEVEARNHFLQQRKDLKEDLEADVHFVETLKEKVGELQSENDELNIKISELEENKEILRTNLMKVAGNDANRIQSLEEKVKVMETCNKELRTRLREHQDRSPMPESSVGTSIAIELTESENMNSSLSEESDDPLQTMQKRYRMLEQELHSVEESKNAKIESLQERIAYLKENEIKLSETLVEMENEEREIRSRLNIYERQGTGGTKSQSLQLTIDRLSMALQETEEEESSQKDKIHSEIDELHHHLQARRGSYGNSLSATKMTSQAFKQFEMTVELIEKKIENFSSTAELMVQDDHYDSVHIGREIDMLKTKWTTFHTSVNDYRKMLDISIQYFTLIEETESWMREANTLLISIGRRAPECRTPEEAEQLLRSLQVFMEEGKPKQEERLQYISELAVQLYGDEGPARIHHLFVQNQDLMQSFQQAETEVSKLQHNLRQEQMVPEPAQEEIVPMEVAVTASIPKNPPKILQHLKDAEVMEGEKVTLECHVESYLPLDVTWYKDNLPLNSPDYETKFDRGVATLTIEETFSEDTAQYTCRLVNEMGAVESSSYLNVRETYQQIVPPEFIKNLKSMDVLESGPFAFECQVTGIPSPTISWYKDDQNVDSSPEYVLTKINGTCCLKIRKINRQHSARYTCSANNPGGEAASSARLTVIPLEKPLIHRFSEDVNIPEGKSVKLEVHFSGSPTPEVTWYRNQDRITPTTVYKITIEVNKSTLEITEAYAEDSGTYKIVLQNTAGEVQRSCQVNVESFYSSTADEMSQASTEAEPMKPTVVQALAPTREVMEGSRVRLDCVIVGHPEPEVIWYRKDKPVKESKDMQLLFEGDRCTLSIREAYLEDSGIYRCVAKNMHGETESVCKLHVEPLSELSDASVGEMSPPKFTQLMRDLSIPCGHRVCLQCRVTGHPVPEVQWFKDNKPIDSSPDYQITAFADVHNLTIPETFEEDSGNYMVKASNLAGEAKCYAKLTVKVPPKPIQEAEVMRLGKVVETKETKMIIGREDLEQAPPEFQKLFQDTTVNAGEAATFECTITGSPKPKIHSEIDELHHHLQARRGSYGNSLSATKMTSQAFKQFKMTVELIEKKIENFSSTAELMVQDDHYDSVHIGREIDMLKTKWTTFHTSVNDYRKMLDISIQYFTLIEETESWMREANTLLISIGRRAPECRTPEEAEQLVRSLQVFMEEGKPKQEERLQYISELAVQLYGDEGPARIHHLFVQNQDLMQSFQQAETEVSKLQHNLRQEQMVPEPAQEEIVPMEVAVTASIPKNPPKILQHLKDAEVMEGEKVTLECHVESYLPLDVTWYKDNLPLNSPDYETKFDRGVATLTIEETFSEDTAQYTCRLVNEMGAVESSSYLNVRETYQQIVPPEFIKNLKSMDVLESGPFAFECQVTGIPSPTISWYKDDQNVDSSPEYVLTKINGTCCLKIRKINRQHSARYTCSANNPGGEAASSARLTVIPLEKPLIHRFSEDVNIPEGKSVKLEVHFSGSPTPEVTWYRNQDRITPTTVYKITIEVNKSTLEITEAYAEDSGTYKIVLQNTAGEVQRSCQVNVESFYSSTADEMSQASTEAEPMKPTVVQALAPTREVMEGSRVRLDCVIVGHPEPEVIWYRKDKPVKESKDMQLLFEGDRCTLSIREAYLEDSGIYRCVAKNMHGETESVCKLHVEPLSELSDASVGEMSPPKFTQLMRDLSIPCGHRVCLQCRVTGHPVPEVQWFKDNKPIDSSPDYQITAFADVHNLTIPETFEEDSGNYMVKASNLAGEAKCYAKLTVKVPPKPIQEAEVMRLGKVVETKETKMIIGREDLEQAPPEFQKLFQDTTVNAGEAATFECTITGSPKPKIHSEIDELHHHLQARRGSYGNSLSATKMTSQAFKQFEMTVELIEKKIENFSSKAELMVQDDHYDSVHIGREIDMLKTKWTTFHTSVNDYRKMLDISIQYFTLIEETESWMREANTLLISIGRRAPECHTPEEAEQLVRSLQVFMEEGKPKQEERLQYISELAVQLYGDEGPARIHHLFVQNQDLMQSFQQAETEVSKLQHNLRQEQMVPEPAQEEIVPMEVAVTASIPKNPPKILQHLKDAEVMEGEKVTLECHVESYLPLDVTWYKDNLPLNSPHYETKFDRGIATLTIEETFSEDTAQYTCRLVNEMGAVESSSYLNVRETYQQIVPPEFIKNLKSMDVLESGPFAFECQVTGIPSPTISWYKDDQNVDSSPEYVLTKINGTCCLKIRKINRQHSARYTCSANNPGGEAASSARLTVIPLEKPLIHRFSEDVNIPEGKSVKLEVHFSGSPTPEVTWYRNQDRITPTTVYKITIEVNKSTLEITEAYAEDSGTYKIVLQNTAGEVQRSCQVNVESFYSSTADEMSQASTEAEPMKPTVVQALAPTREVMEGSRVRLDCVIVGHPEPEVIWYRKDKPVKESKDMQLLFEGDRCTLSIREAYLEDSGIYRCVAKNMHGETESVYKLHVEPLSELSDASVGEMSPPKFTQLMRDLSIPCGHRVCLQCRVTGHPVPEVQWFKDNKPIDSSPDYQITAFADVHNLTIPETFEEDSGNYMVKASNLAGEAKCYAKLTVKVPPEPIQEAEVMRLGKVVETKETKMIIGREDLEQAPPEFQKLFQDTTVNAGEAATFECTITGSPKPKVTWYFNGEPVVSRDYQITMEGNKYKLHIPETFDEDAGRFSITAENPSGKATCSALLNVDEEQTIQKTRIFGNSEISRVSRTEIMTSIETHVSRVVETMDQEPTYVPSYEMHSTTLRTDAGQPDEMDYVPSIESREHYATTLKTDVPPKFQPVDLTIEVPIPPKFLQPLKNITSMEGTKVTFDGVVSGKPEPTIKWFREGKELSDQADFEIAYRNGRVSLTIPEVFEEDAGRFSCQANNPAGQATSSAELFIKASMTPPTFIQKLPSSNVAEGKPIRFTVRVAGKPPPTVTWLREGTQIVSSPDFEIIQEGDIHSLYIPEVFQEDAGKFTVLAENPAGKSQCTADLRIEVPMEETEAPVERPVTEIKERFEPKRAPPRHAPPPVPTEEPETKVAKLQRPSQFVKQIEPVKPREPSPRMFKEQFQVEVEGKPELPLFEQRFTLPQEAPPAAPVIQPVTFKPVERKVPPPVKEKPAPAKQKPVFTKGLKDITRKEGEGIVFECIIESHPEPIVKWYREDIIISSSPDYEITWENNVAKLAIAEIFPEDAGVFRCTATNTDGSTSSEARLSVQPCSPVSVQEQPRAVEEPMYQAFAPKREVPVSAQPVKPEIVDKPVNCRLVEGTNAVFESRVTGTPFPEVAWMKRGFPIRKDNRHRITVDEKTGRCSLLISHTKPDDAGEYTCTAVNVAGDASATAALIPVEAKAPSPPPMPSIPVAPLKSWRPVPVAEPAQKVAAPAQEPMVRKPWQPVAEPAQKVAAPVKEPMMRKPWEPTQEKKPDQAPWQQWTPPSVEQIQKREAPTARTEPKFVIPHSEKILESNLQYRQMKEPDLQRPPPAAEVIRSTSIRKTFSLSSYV